jgi:hypothetical protein
MNPGLVHPGFAGHAKMADAWYAAIKNDLGCSTAVTTTTAAPSTTAATTTTLPPTTTVASTTTTATPTTTVTTPSTTGSPIPATTTPSATTTPVATTLPVAGNSWLKVEHSGGYRQFLLGYGSGHVWSPTLSPATGAKNLTLRLQDLGNGVDWKALSVRPQSKPEHAVSIGEHIASGTVTTQPFTVTIPVAAFGPDAFTNISQLSFFNASPRNPFTLAVHEVSFDRSPALVWFGSGHSDNAFEGNPGNGQMTVTRMTGTPQPPTIPNPPTTNTPPTTGITTPTTTAAPITVTMQASGGGRYKQYDSIPVTITVTNNSTSAMVNKVVKVTVPSEVVSGGATPTTGKYLPWPGTVHDWNIPSLAAGQSATVVVKMFTKVGGVPLPFRADLDGVTAQIIVNP